MTVFSGPPCIVISYVTKLFYTIRFTIQSSIHKLQIKLQRVILRGQKKLKTTFFPWSKGLKKIEKFGLLPGLNMGPNFKMIFFYAYPMPKLSTVKELLKNIVKQKSWFWLTFKFWPYFGPPCIVIRNVTKIFYIIRFTIQSSIHKLLIKFQKVIWSGQKKSKPHFFDDQKYSEKNSKNWKVWIAPLA